MVDYTNTPLPGQEGRPDLNKGGVTPGQEEEVDTTPIPSGEQESSFEDLANSLESRVETQRAEQAEIEETGDVIVGEEHPPEEDNNPALAGPFTRGWQKARSVVGHTADRFATEFTDVWGGGPIIPIPENPFGVESETGQALLKPLSMTSNAVLAGADLSLRSIASAYMGSVGAFNQSLKEFGVRDTEANRLTRDFVAAADVLSVATGGIAPGLRKIAKSISNNKKPIQTYREEVRRSIDEKTEARAINQARETAMSRGEDPDLAEAKLKKTVKEQDGADVTASGSAYWDKPEDIIRHNPVFTQEVLQRDVLEGMLADANSQLNQLGINTARMTNDQVFQTIMDNLASGRMSFNKFREAAEANGRSMEEIVQLFGATRSESGKLLRAQREFTEKRLRELAFKGDEDAQEFLRASADLATKRFEATRGAVLTGNEAYQPFGTRMARSYRQLLVSLPSTAVRNAIESGVIRPTVSMMSKGMDVTLRRMFTPSAPIEPMNTFDEIGRMFSVMRGGNTQKQLDELYKAFPETQNQLMGGLEADDAARVALTPTASKMDKAKAGATHTLLAMNRLQSKIQRQAIFAAELDRKLQATGSSLEKMIDYRTIPAGFNRSLSEAMDVALYNDFVMPIKGKGSLETMFRGYADFLDGLNRAVPMAGAMIEPFPRFMYNFARLTLEHTPTGGMRLISPKARARMLEGDFSDFGKEFVATSIFGSALALRSGNFPGIEPGERFDEVELGDGSTISLAPFATFIPHLALADMALRIEDGRLTSDTATARELISNIRGGIPQLQRGTHAINEAFRAVGGIEDWEDIEALATLSPASEFMSEQLTQGFLRPMVLINDFRAEFEEGMRVARSTRGQGALGSVVKMLDPDGSVGIADSLGFPNGLPELQVATRAAPPTKARVQLSEDPEIDIGAGLFSQVTGAKVNEPRNAIEKEIDDLGFNWRSLMVNSGDKRFDQLVLSVQGPILEQLGEMVAHSKTYQELGVKKKQEIVRNLINISRQPAIEAAKAVAPSTAAKLKIQRVPSVRRGAILETLDEFLHERGAEYTSRDLMRGFQEKSREELERLGF